jgi:hypothetical protein
MADYTPPWTGGLKPRTYTAGAAITGGQVVAASANNTVIPTAGVSAAVVGVAAHDAASGALVAVWPLAGVTHEVTAAAVLAAGGVVTSAASGQITAAAAQTGTDLIGVVTVGAASAAKAQFLGR